MSYVKCLLSFFRGWNNTWEKQTPNKYNCQKNDSNLSSRWETDKIVQYNTIDKRDDGGL